MTDANETEPVQPSRDDTREAELRDIERLLQAQRARSGKLDMDAVIRRKKQELDRATKEADEKELLTQLEEEHGELGKKIAYYRTAGGLVVVKRSGSVAWRRYMYSKQKMDDVELLVRACLVHPTEAQFDKIVEEEPAMLIGLSNKLGELYGIRKQEEEEGK